MEEYKIRKSDYFKDETRTLEQLIFNNQEDALNALQRIKNNIENFSTIFPEKLISIDDIAKSELPEKLAEPVFNDQINDLEQFTFYNI